MLPRCEQHYRIEVGRSRDVTGPYEDAEGRSMLEDGGTPVLSTGGAVGPGGQSLSDGHLGFTSTTRRFGGDFRLAIRELERESDGWPTAHW